MASRLVYRVIKRTVPRDGNLLTWASAAPKIISPYPKHHAVDCSSQERFENRLYKRPGTC